MHAPVCHRRSRGLSALALALSLGLAGCTVLLDRKAEQCSSDDDCAQLFSGTVCSAEHVCVDACTSNRDCSDGEGELQVCRKSDRTCVALTSPECSRVEGGDPKDDNALVIGSVLPLSGGEQATGDSIHNAILLAAGEVEQLGWLPSVEPQGGRRPIVVVGCDDAGLNDQARKAGAHLADVGVPAIIGAASSGRTTAVFDEANLAHKVLVISSTATANYLTDWENDTDGLLWRTSPSDEYQSRALIQYFDVVAEEVRADIAPPGGGDPEPIRLAILQKGDGYGDFLARQLAAGLTLNGAPVDDLANQDKYARVNYGDPGAMNGSVDYAAAIDKVIALKPHIVVLIGLSEVVTQLMVPIEGRWAETGADHLPRYILSDGSVSNALWETVGRNDGLRRRISGTVPGSAGPLFNAFKQQYNAKYQGAGTSPDSFGAAGAYDATYLLAYSAVSARVSAPDGLALAAGMKNTVSPSPEAPALPIDVGPGSINDAFKELAKGRPIDFNGASGPLDFDTTTGEAPSDIQIWCLPTDGTTAQSAQNSGLHYDAASGELLGSIGAVCD